MQHASPGTLVVAPLKPAQLNFSSYVVVSLWSRVLALQPFTFTPLLLGTIQPSGWFGQQLQLSADGLAGHEMDFYDFVANSTCSGGGSEHSELNEGLPYWFNGVVSLAYGLGDARLQQQVRQAI